VFGFAGLVVGLNRMVDSGSGHRSPPRRSARPHPYPRSGHWLAVSRLRRPVRRNGLVIGARPAPMSTIVQAKTNRVRGRGRHSGGTAAEPPRRRC